MKKKVLAVLLGGCMVAGLLAGCGGGSDSSSSDNGDAAATDEGSGGGDYHFEVVVKSFQSTYWQAAIQGIDAAVEELGVKVNTTGPNAESDIADQVNMDTPFSVCLSLPVPVLLSSCRFLSFSSVYIRCLLCYHKRNEL